MPHKLGRRDLFSMAALAATTTRGATAPPEGLTAWMKAGPAARSAGVQSCLERIQKMDPDIHAWVQVLPQKATGSGPLSGIPFGVKDIIETENLATEYGSPVYKGRRGTADAAIVRLIRSLGAILLGKTQTTAFAYRTPAPTRNPRDLTHTPGGSSSGSAAAVAAGMIPFALGTQTLGSVLRPASYCGVTGFKPGHGFFSMEGVLPLARSLDTLGLFTNTPSDMILLWEALGNSLGREDSAFALGVPEPLPDVEPEMASGFRATVARIQSGGISIRPVKIAPILDKLAPAARLIEFYEGARFHEQRYKQYGSRLQDIADLVREGLQIPQNRYDETRALIVQSKQQVSELFLTTPVILTPAATGPAPLGLTSTGDPRMNGPWTALGTPAISIPMPVRGLPLGLQLTAERGQEARVLHTAKRLENLFVNGVR